MRYFFSPVGARLAAARGSGPRPRPLRGPLPTTDPSQCRPHTQVTNASPGRPVPWQASPQAGPAPAPPPRLPHTSVTNPFPVPAPPRESPPPRQPPPPTPPPEVPSERSSMEREPSATAAAPAAAALFAWVRDSASGPWPLGLRGAQTLGAPGLGVGGPGARQLRSERRSWLEDPGLGAEEERAGGKGFHGVT